MIGFSRRPAACQWIDKHKRAGCNEPFPITPPHCARRWRFIRTDGNLGRMPISTSQKPPADRRDLEYFAMAVCYGNAATLLNKQAVTGKSIYWPFFQLVAHALELSLKAALSHQGRDEEWLMMIGHSLERCYTQAISGGLYTDRDPATDALMGSLDKPHALQVFRYPQNSRWVAPDPHWTIQTMETHLEIVRRYLAIQTGADSSQV